MQTWFGFEQDVIDACDHLRWCVRAGGGHFEYMLCNEYPLNPVYTIQPVVKPVVKRAWQPVWQQVVSCKRGFNVIRRNIFL